MADRQAPALWWGFCLLSHQSQAGWFVVICHVEKAPSLQVLHLKIGIQDHLALRAGQPHMFFSEEEPFGGFRQDAAAVSAALVFSGVSVWAQAESFIGTVDVPLSLDK